MQCERKVKSKRNRKTRYQDKVDDDENIKTTTKTITYTHTHTHVHTQQDREIAHNLTVIGRLSFLNPLERDRLIKFFFIVTNNAIPHHNSNE